MEVFISIYNTFGIYAIQNMINGKTYVGKTQTNFGDRWDCHRSQLRGGYHDNPHLQRAWNKYGEENFRFIIVEVCPEGTTTEEINELEIKYIKIFKNYDEAYNISPGGDGGMFLGKHLPEETKRKIGEKNRIHMTGRHASEKTKKKMAESQRKRWDNLSAKEKEKTVSRLRKANSGRKWDQKRREEYVKAQQTDPHGAKYSIDTIKEIRRLHEEENLSYTDISQKLDIPRGTVYNIATYRRWKNV